MAEYDGSIRIGTKIEIKEAEKELKTLESSILKTAEKISSLQSKMDALKNVTVPTKEYGDLQKQVESLEKKLLSVYDRQEKFLSTGGKEDSSVYKKMVYDADQLEKKLQSLESAMQTLSDSGRAFTIGEDTEEYKKIAEQIAQLNEQMQSEQQRIAELQKEITEEEQRLADIKNNATVTDQNIVNLLERRKELMAEINDLQKAGVTEGYKEYDDAQKELSAINQKVSDYQKGNKAPTEEEQRLAQMKANAAVSDQKIVSLLERQKQLTQEIKELEKAGIGYGYQQYDSKQQELASVSQQIKDYKNNLQKVPEQFEKMNNSAKKAFDAMSSGSKKSSGLLHMLSRRMTYVMSSLLLFNWIMKAFNAMIAGMGKGFTNLMEYSSDFADSIQSMKNSMSTLGNQFAAAFSPIVQLVIPWLRSLIDTITTALSYVSQFIAVLGGSGTWTKATQIQDKYNSSLKETAGAAKKAAGALASFDTIEVLSKKDSGGSGAGEEQTSPKDMFEEVPVDPKLQKWLDGVKEKMKPILDYMGKLKDIFMEGFWDGLGDWEYRWDSIKESIASIKESLIDIFTDPAVVTAADQYYQSLAYMLGSLVGTTASIGLTIAANILGGIAKYLEGNKDRIKKFLISMFDIGEDINYLLAELFQAIGYIFEAFASENGQQFTANIIGIFANGFMGALELAGKLARDILEIFIQPFVENKEELREALEEFLGVVADVAGTVKDAVDETFDELNKVYDEHFKPFFDSIAKGLSEILAHFLEFWNGTVQPILEEWAEKFDVLFKEHIQPLINNFIGLLGDIADMLKALWENWLAPLVHWLIDNLLPEVTAVIDGIVSVLMPIIGIVADVAGSVIDGIRSIVNFLKHVFQKDWEAAWDDVLYLLKGPLVTDLTEAGGNLVHGIVDGIKEAWNSLKETIGSVAESVSERFRSILGIHSPSTVFAEFGGYIIEGLKNGISDTIGSVFELFGLDKWVQAGQGMIDGITESIAGFKELWDTSFSEWKELNEELYFGYDVWYEQFYNIMLAYTDVNTEFMAEWSSAMNAWWTTMVTPFFTVEQWKIFGTNMKTGIMNGFKVIINEMGGVLNNMIKMFDAAFEELEEAMNDLISDYNKSASILGTSKLSKVSYSAMGGIKVPALADGAVIRGGNPFLAILGDQRAGQTNIEAPVPTIEEAVENAMRRIQLPSAPSQINLYMDSEKVAQATLDSFLAELDRRGYDLDLIGG